MTRITPPEDRAARRWMLPEHMIDNPAIRRMLGDIARNTLLSWRKTRGFPEPVKTLSIGDIWDLREVREWIRVQAMRG